MTPARSDGYPEPPCLKASRAIRPGRAGWDRTDGEGFREDLRIPGTLKRLRGVRAWNCGRSDVIQVSGFPMETDFAAINRQHDGQQDRVRNQPESEEETERPDARVRVVAHVGRKCGSPQDASGLSNRHRHGEQCKRPFLMGAIREVAGRGRFASGRESRISIPHYIHCNKFYSGRIGPRIPRGFNAASSQGHPWSNWPVDRR